ncbi:MULTISPECIES: hypothetical protein [Thalassospira]|uniref:Uncharacterized protein n=2 Tax=Thalassospira TaxID=168934 RepID=A0A367W3S3_9PROT|nr:MULTISPECIES: hypothetical protein [Thalassospira]MDG4720736.1 hypothetical protein [Thalassospira sp. FZY0004]RCK35064.1 hypothetical protein TH19_15225 [Thalassospira profundimaris]
MTDNDDTQSGDGYVGAWPSAEPKIISRMPPGDWEPTKTVEEIDPENPDIPPELPEPSPEWEFEWQRTLKPPSQQHKPGLPNIGLGPFDKPLEHWRLYRRPFQ